MAILYNKQNVAVGIAVLWVSEFGTELPPLTLGWGVQWPEEWRHPGATSEGVSLSVELENNPISIEESATPALIVGTNLNITLEADLAEDTLENMQLAYGAGGQLDTFAATDVMPGYKRLTLSADLGELAVGLDMKLRSGLFRRLHIPYANSVGTTETSYRRSENARTYPTSIQSLSDPEETYIDEVTEPPLGGDMTVENQQAMAALAA